MLHKKRHKDDFKKSSLCQNIRFCPEVSKNFLTVILSTLSKVAFQAVPHFAGSLFVAHGDCCEKNSCNSRNRNRQSYGKAKQEKNELKGRRCHSIAGSAKTTNKDNNSTQKDGCLFQGLAHFFVHAVLHNAEVKVGKAKTNIME